MLFAGVNTHLLDRKKNGNLLELQLGNEFRKDKLITTFTLLNNNTAILQPTNYQNEVSYGVNNLYAKTKYLKIFEYLPYSGFFTNGIIFSLLQIHSIGDSGGRVFV